MSLKKAIEHGKEKRQPYRKAKKHSKGCRNHGNCSYCLNNREHSTRIRELAATPEEESWTSSKTELN